MSFWNPFATQEEIRERTVSVGPGEIEVGRPYVSEFQHDKLVKRHPGDIEEVMQSGAFAPVFRWGAVQFTTLKGCAAYRLNCLLRFGQETEADIEGKVREITAEECKAEVSEVTARPQEEIVSRLVAAFTRPGGWREVMVTSKKEWGKYKDRERARREDLKNRLLEVFGNEINLSLFANTRPDIFERAYAALPPGQSENDLLKEEEEMIERSRQHRQQQIAEAREFLRKLK